MTPSDVRIDLPFLKDGKKDKNSIKHLPNIWEHSLHYISTLRTERRYQILWAEPCPVVTHHESDSCQTLGYQSHLTWTAASARC